MPRSVDINCDMGESYGRYTLGVDAEIISYISSANIACMFHAGDPSTMRKTVRLAARNGVAVGAHPGLPDLLGFGRRVMLVGPEELRDYLVYQIGALNAFCTIEGVPLQHVKLHGALYNMASRDVVVAEAVVDAVRDVNHNLILVAQSGSILVDVARRKGLRVAREVFADREYGDDGLIISGAVISDPEKALKQVLKVALEGKVVARSGKVVDCEGETFCLHGDNSAALEIAKRLASGLKEAGVEIRPLGSFLA